MIKQTTPGSEVDAYCTKCKLDLNHRIIAMDGDKIVRVECLTCRGHHNYRRPKSAEPPATKSKRKAAGSRAAKKPSRQSAAEQLRATWENAIMGRTPEDFTPYKMTVPLEPGQLVRHKKFGDGVVSELCEGSKALVLFEAGHKTLVHGR